MPSRRSIGDSPRSSGSSIGTCADVEALAAGLDETARADDRAVGEPQQPGVQRVAVVSITSSSVTPLRGQLRRIDLDVLLLEALAPDRDVGHAGHAQQALPDLPVGDRRHSIRSSSCRTSARSS